MRRILAMIMIILMISPAKADWVMCQPDGEVRVRKKPSISSEEVARVYPMDEVVVDKVKNGWSHVIIGCEAGEGWNDHLTGSEPEFFPDGKIFIATRGKLAVRRSINGEIIKKIKKGTEVKVFYRSEDWSVTSIGYIKSEFLEAEDE